MAPALFRCNRCIRAKLVKYVIDVNEIGIIKPQWCTGVSKTCKQWTKDKTRVSRSMNFFPSPRVHHYGVP